MSRPSAATLPSSSTGEHGTASDPSLVEFGQRMLRLRWRRLHALVPARRLHVTVVLVCATLVAALLSMTIGDYGIAFGDVLAALAGSGPPDAQQVVTQWRLPRVLFAILCGAALAYSGAVFQTLTRNPLGSPDIIGFAAGSFLAVTFVTVVADLNTYPVKAGAALAGGFVTALLVYALAYRKGLSSFRLIIVGIGVSAALASLTSWIFISVSIEKAMVAATWGAGSIASLGFDQFWPALLVFAILWVAGLPLGRSLPMVEMGDETASALGVRVGRVRLHALLVGVGMVALVTAAAGPISFIALAAPQIAQRLTRAQTPMQPVTAMCTGALLVVLADILALSWRLPVGIVTVSIGGLYLAWLLARQYRTRA